jgi:hypothetical protein
MNFFSRKTARQTKPQVDPAQVRVNVMATLREQAVEAIPYERDPELTQRIEDALTLQRWARKVAIKARRERVAQQKRLAAKMAAAGKQLVTP